MSNQSGGNAGKEAEIQINELASLCDEACDIVTNWHSVVAEFSRLVRESLEQGRFEAISEMSRNRVDAIVIAFQYGLQVQPDDRSGLRKAFTPMFEYADGTQVPPKVNELPHHVIETWAEISRQLTHPGASSRINDLLFCVGETDAGFYARSAIDAYVNVMLSNWTALEATHALLRAFILARGTRDDLRADHVVSSMEQHFWANIRLNVPPGITMPLIAALLDVDRSGSDVDRMISEARQIYLVPHLADQLISWQIRRSRNQEQRQQYGRERVGIWLNAAAGVQPLIRVMYLETAAGYVDEASDPELKRQVRLLLQSAGKEDLGLKRLVTGLTLADEEVENYLAPFSEASGWQEALDNFSRYPPPTGSYEENLRLADEVDATAPFQAMIPRVRLGGDGLPRWRPLTEEDQLDARLARQEESLALIVGNLLAEGLRRIGKRYPRPNRQAIADYLAVNRSLSLELATQLAAAIDLYWAGDEDAAAYMATLLIEALLRNLLLQANQGIYSVQRNKKPGQYPGLSFLLKALRDLGFDLSWYRYLWTVFASPGGLNLRNEIAHGFTHHPGTTAAALSIHACCFLTTIQVTSDSDAPS